MVSHLNLSVMDTDDLAPSLREELIRLCIAAFQKDDFANLFVYFPTGRRHFLAHLGERLIGHAVVTTRWVQPEGARVLRTAYVDAVAIAPDLQRQGYGTQLMEYLGREIADYELGCLATRSPGFYGRMGWEAWGGPQAGRDETGVFQTPDQRGTMVLRLASTPPFELDGLLTIEKQDGRVWRARGEPVSA